MSLELENRIASTGMATGVPSGLEEVRMALYSLKAPQPFVVHHQKGEVSDAWLSFANDPDVFAVFIYNRPAHGGEEGGCLVPSKDIQVISLYHSLLLAAAISQESDTCVVSAFKTMSYKAQGEPDHPLRSAMWAALQRKLLENVLEQSPGKITVKADPHTLNRLPLFAQAFGASVMPAAQIPAGGGVPAVC